MRTSLDDNPNRSAELTKTCPLRVDNRSLPSLGGSTMRIITSIRRPATLPLLDPAQPTPSPARILLLSYPSLQALTILTCLVASCLQFRTYTLSLHRPGAISDADFYSNLQSVLMQLLTTYTGLVPTVRSSSVQGFVSVFWVSLLSIAGVVLNLVAAGIFFHDEAMAPLLGFFRERGASHCRTSAGNLRRGRA